MRDSSDPNSSCEKRAPAVALDVSSPVQRTLNTNQGVCLPCQQLHSSSQKKITGKRVDLSSHHNPECVRLTNGAAPLSRPLRAAAGIKRGLLPPPPGRDKKYKAAPRSASEVISVILCVEICCYRFETLGEQSEGLWRPEWRLRWPAEVLLW